MSRDRVWGEGGFLSGWARFGSFHPLNATLPSAQKFPSGPSWFPVVRTRVLRTTTPTPHTINHRSSGSHQPRSPPGQAPPLGPREEAPPVPCGGGSSGSPLPAATCRRLCLGGSFRRWSGGAAAAACRPRHLAIAITARVPGGRGCGGHLCGRRWEGRRRPPARTAIGAGRCSGGHLSGCTGGGREGRRRPLQRAKE